LSSACQVAVKCLSGSRKILFEHSLKQALVTETLILVYVL